MTISSPPAVDLTVPRSIHVVGAGGAGMSAIATVLASMGHRVTGSDIKPSPSVDRLRACGVQVQVGHRPENVLGADAVAVSTAVSERNIEVDHARRLGIPVLSRAAMLAAIAGLRRTIAIAGTHGKTTTASMLSLILLEAGLHPSFIIGGEVNEIGTNASWDDGEWLVVEADESDGTFLQLMPELAIVTSVESDHLEHYGSFEVLRAAFGEFLRQSESAIVCADDPVAAGLAPDNAQTYGFSDGATMQIVDLESARNELRFELINAGTSIGRFELPVPGAHNALNAAAAVSGASVVGADPEHSRRALSRFAGVARRYEFRGEVGGVTFVDDYAHLPGEVRAAISAGRSGSFERIVVVFQPHRYSRVATLAAGFADAFEGADVVLISEIYPAGEAPRPGVSGKLVLEAVLGAHPEAVARYVPGREDLVSHLRKVLRPGDLCLTLAAGDLTNLAAELGQDEQR